MNALTNLDWTEILSRLEKFATSEAGRKNIRALEILGSPEEAKKSFDEIYETQQILLRGARPHMESLDLFSVWHLRLTKGGVLRPLELRDVRHFCVECIALKELLRANKFSWSQESQSLMMNASEPLSAIDQLMSPDGEIRTDASETLYNLYHERSAQVRQVQNILDRLVKDHELTTVLQDRYVTNREGRWVLPIKSGMRHDFDGIIHGSSQTKQTVFMEPKEVIPLNNRVRELDVAIEEEVERLLSQLAAYLSTLNGPFETSRQVMERADLRFAQGQLAIHLDAKPCQFSQKELFLTKLRHPLLALGKTQVVANTVELEQKRHILLLSGPNAGGKTVLLKSVGLAAQMARCGLPICADEGSKLPFFKQLHVAVGDSQNVDAHLSTFAAHLQILNQASAAQGSDHLLLVDEICGSTDPEEGSALARAFIEAFSANNVFAVITSHLGPLKLGWKADSGVINGSLEYDAQTGRPTYQFLMGVPGQSLALKTARRVGIAAPILNRAMNLLSPEIKKFLSDLEEVEQMKTELRTLKDEANRETSQAKAQQLELDKKLVQFEKEKEKLLEQALREAEGKLDAMIEQSKVTDVFRKHENLEKMRSQLPEVVKFQRSQDTGPARIESADDFARAFPPGSRVFATSLGRDGVIQGAPNNRGEVPILSNSMRMFVPWESLKPPSLAQNPTMDLVRRTHSLSVSPLDSDRQIDLRGLKAEEAIQNLENQLDVAVLNDEDRVKIIHGHGTDALKKAIRTYLSRSLYVKKWQAGNADTGGDGVTWVELSDEAE